MTRPPPTCTLENASESPWDALVIGAGCAGAVAAHELARKGARVLVVDKSNFPRYKVCGCCINQPAQDALESIGLGDLLKREGAVTAKTFTIQSGGVRASFPLPEYAVLSRERFDAALVQSATDEGATFLPGTQATLHTVTDAMRSVWLRTGTERATVHAKIVVVADGLGSRLLSATGPFDSPSATASRIGMGAISTQAPLDYQTGTIYMACAPSGYVGACRLEDGRLALASACSSDYVKSVGGLSRAVSEILREAGYAPLPDIDAIPWKGTPALTREATTVSAHRAFVLGDAAGYLEPFTGEGMKWAMESAIALAPIARNAVESYDTRYEQEWAAARQHIVSRRTTVCRILAASLRYPALVRAALRVLAVAPAAAAPFVRSLNAPRPAQKEVLL